MFVVWAGAPSCWNMTTVLRTSGPSIQAPGWAEKPAQTMTDFGSCIRLTYRNLSSMLEVEEAIMWSFWLFVASWIVKIFSSENKIKFKPWSACCLSNSLLHLSCFSFTVARRKCTLYRLKEHISSFVVTTLWMEWRDTLNLLATFLINRRGLRRTLFRTTFTSLGVVTVQDLPDRGLSPIPPVSLNPRIDIRTNVDSWWNLTTLKFPHEFTIFK